MNPTVLDVNGGFDPEFRTYGKKDPAKDREILQGNDITSYGISATHI